MALAQHTTRLLQDLRLSSRQLLRQPGVTLAILLTMALGIGANTAVFSILHGVLLSPLPYVEPQRLAQVWPGGSLPRAGFVLMQEETRAFQQIAGYSLERKFSLVGGGEPERLDGVATTASFFQLLGVPAAVGRTFQEGDDQPGMERTVVLSHSFHQRRYGGDPGVVGRTVRLDGVDRAVIGVMPEHFRFPSRETEVWIPAVIDPRDFQTYWGGLGSLQVIGRLADGTDFDRAREELGVLIPRIRDGFPWEMPPEYGQSATVVPLKQHLTGDVRPILLSLMAAVALILLIACVNVANLLLVRARARRKELAVRAALGASRSTLLRQLLTESLVLAVLSGLLGLAVGAVGLVVMRTQLPSDLARIDEIQLDPTVLGFTLVLALGTGLLFGLIPAFRASRPQLEQTLRDSGSGSGAGRGQHRTMAALVTAEVALTVALTIGAGLVFQSFWHQLRIDPGFIPTRVVTASVAPPELRYDTPESQHRLYQELMDSLAALPGVRDAAAVDRLPFSDGVFGTVFLIDGRPFPRGGDWPMAEAFSTVSSNYLRSLGVPLVRGRWFTPQDRADAPGVVLVSQSLAERYWSGQDVLGQRIQFPGTEQWLTVVGIVADLKFDQLVEDTRTALYRPLLQSSGGPMSMVLRTDGDPRRLASEVRSAASRVEPDMPVSEILTLDERISASLTRPRLLMQMLLIFAVVALSLAAVGIYGVTAYAVGQRQQELAVRLALGATPRELLLQFLRRGLLLSLLGITLGVPLALGMGQIFEALLYGLSAHHPATLTLAALALALVATIATWLPARRILRVDPMPFLRIE